MNVRILRIIAFVAIWIQFGGSLKALEMQTNIIVDNIVALAPNAKSNETYDETESDLSLDEINELMSEKASGTAFAAQHTRRKLHYFAHAPHVMAAFSGAAFLALNEDEEAFHAFEAAASYRPNYAEAFSGQAIALRRMKKSEEALRAINEAVRLKPRELRFILFRADLSSEMGDGTGVLGDYTKALEIDPKINTVRYFRAIIYQKNGLLKEAEKDLDILLDPASQFDIKYVPLVYKRKGAVAADLGNMDAAVECYDKLISMFNGGLEQAWAFAERGELFFRQGKYKEALSDFEDAIRIVPSNATDDWTNEMRRIVNDRIQSVHKILGEPGPGSKKGG